MRSRRTAIHGVWLGLLAAALAPGTAVAASTLYVGDAKPYSVAFKAEEAQLYLLQFAGTARCYYTEPHEDVGPSGFSVFARPTLMSMDAEGYVAEESWGDMFGGGSARIRVDAVDAAVRGTFEFDESEESFHCDTGFSGVPFEAPRFEPIGSPTAAPPVTGEARAYYGSEGPVEIFLRNEGRRTGGIRGTFAPQCPVGRGGAIPARHALFARPASAEWSGAGYFRRRVVEEGRARSGTGFRETITLAGRVEEAAVTGTYLRVRTMKPRRGPKQRCATGPLPFSAVRYLPAR
jgi:hypothetical protein